MFVLRSLKMGPRNCPEMRISTPERYEGAGHYDARQRATVRRIGHVAKPLKNNHYRPDVGLGMGLAGGDDAAADT